MDLAKRKQRSVNSDSLEINSLKYERTFKRLLIE